MEYWAIVGVVILLLLLFFFKTQSYADTLSSPEPSPAPAAIPSSKWTRSMVIPPGASCDPGWTKIGNVTCAK